jgi:hypothetical protein
MWDLKCKIIAVITGAIGIATKDLGENLESVPGKISVDSPQKQLYVEHPTYYGMYCSPEFEA